VSTNLKIEKKLEFLAAKYAAALKTRIEDRVLEMGADNNAHYLIYRVLGISLEEGQKIDVYQNKGRFLYKYAGSFLEESAKLCFKEKFPDSGSTKIPNTTGLRPKTFEIDCLISNGDAIEIKWRDATTDGDHITKEHTRIQTIAAAGFKPIRVMFYYPQREQAIRIQKALETLYLGVNGSYYYGHEAWTYVKNYTGVDLESILKNIAGEKISHD
jgi:hypothetical protein